MLRSDLWCAVPQLHRKNMPVRFGLSPRAKSFASPPRCCLGHAAAMVRPLPLLATLAGPRAGPWPARPCPMAIGPIPTDRRRTGGLLAASGPKEGR